MSESMEGIPEEVEEALEAEIGVVKKVLTLASRRDIRVEVDFEDQEIEIDGDTAVLNGRTVIECGRK